MNLSCGHIATVKLSDGKYTFHVCDTCKLDPDFSIAQFTEEKI